jgi:hypothetical protein
MSLTLKTLSAGLNWGLIQKTDRRDEVLSVRTIDESNRFFRENILYIGTQADFDLLPGSSPLMFLCADGYTGDLLTLPDHLSLLYPLAPMSVSDCESAVYALLEQNCRMNECSRMLYENMISGKGLEKMAEAAQGIFNNPVILLDRSFRVLAFSDCRQNPASGIWKDILDCGCFPEQYIHEFSENPKFSDSVFIKCEPVILQDKQSPHRYLLCRIQNNGNYIGFAALLETNRPFTDTDLHLFKILIKIVAYEFKSNPALRDPKRQKYEQFIAEILDGDLTQQQIQDRFAQIKLNLKKFKFVYVFSFYQEKSVKSEQLEYMCDRIEMIAQNGKCSIYNEKIVMLLSADSSVALPASVHDALRAYVKNNGMICGISNHFTNLTELPKAYRQSQAVIHLGKRLQRQEYMLLYWTFSCLDMIESLHDKNNLLDYCNPTLLGILDYDAENKTAYSKTLRHYIDNGKNPNQTALELGVHRNTVDYRINRIKELFDVDFENPQLVFSFELSYRIFYFIDKYYLDQKPNQFHLLG